jgi:hypothetical protein
MSIHTVFNKILVFLRLRKKSEVHCVLASETRMFWDFQLFNIDDHNRRSRLVDFYYVLYRFFHYNPWGNPRRAYREIKWFIQRGRRGWADCDVWGLDDYLSRWLPDALRRLKKTKQGVPGSLFEDADCIPEGTWQGNPSEEGMKRASDRWDAIMDKMIAGFEANNAMQDGIYEKELGEYPLDRPAGVSAEAWEKTKNDRFARSRILDKHYEAIWQEGAALFIKHFQSLWD